MFDLRRNQNRSLLNTTATIYAKTLLDELEDWIEINEIILERAKGCLTVARF